MIESFPLVGLHGRVDDVGIVALGFIMLDVFTDECRHDTKTNPDLQAISYANEDETNILVEGLISQEERERSQLLESILRFNLMKDAE